MLGGTEQYGTAGRQRVLDAQVLWYRRLITPKVRKKLVEPTVKGISTKGLRTCVGCAKKKSPDQLVRLRISDGDHTSLGRGAWVCRDSLGCFDRAAERGQFQRAFRAKIDPTQLDMLRVSYLNTAAPSKALPSTSVSGVKKLHIDEAI